MINTSFNAIRTPQSPPPSAIKLTAGVHGGNIKDVAENLAQDSATVLGALDRPTRTELAQDVKALKVQLGVRLADQQMHNALMTAGALMGGPHGVVVTSLHEQLKATLASPKKLDELAEKVAKFGERGPNETPPTRGDVYQSLNTQLTGALVREKVGGDHVPSGTFLAGALANSYQDQGGYFIAS